MKKILSALAVACTVSAFSQTVWTDDFESYTPGAIDTQNGWNRDGGGSPTWTQIKTVDAAHGQSFQLASTSANSEGVWHYHDTNWTAKDSDNNIFVLEFDHYTGAETSGLNALQTYTPDYAMPFEFGWSSYDKQLYIKIEDRTGVIIHNNAMPATWYSVKISYNTATGQIKAQVNNSGPVSEISTAPDLQPTELDILLYSVTNGAYDNIKVSAVSEDPFLSVSDSGNKSGLTVYPNPATDVVNVKSDSKINMISVFDLSGKLVGTSSENTVNIAKLAKGSYVLRINYANGTSEVKKVIKK